MTTVPLPILVAMTTVPLPILFAMTAPPPSPRMAGHDCYKTTHFLSFGGSGCGIKTALTASSNTCKIE